MGAVAEPSVVPEGWSVYRHPAGLFALAYPEGWRALEPKSDVACFCMAGPGERYFFEVMALGIPEDKRDHPARVIRRMLLDSLRDQHGDKLRVFGDFETSGDGVRLVVETPGDAPGARFKAVTDYFLNSNATVVITINFKAVSRDYKRLAPLFENIARTLALGA